MRMEPVSEGLSHRERLGNRETEKGCGREGWEEAGGGRLATPRGEPEPLGSGKKGPAQRRGAPLRSPVINRAC